MNFSHMRWCYIYKAISTQKLNVPRKYTNLQQYLGIISTSMQIIILVKHQAFVFPYNQHASFRKLSFSTCLQIHNS